MRLLWCILAWTITITGLIIFFAWLIGKIFSNMFSWSQWLFWLPSPLILVVLLVCLVGGLRQWHPLKIQWQRMLPLLVAFLVVALAFTFWEHRLLAGAPSAPTGLSILSWTMPSRTEEAVGEEAFLGRVNADVALLTWGDDMKRAQPEWQPLLPNHRFYRGGVASIISRYPVQEIRPVVSRDEMRVVLAILNADPIFTEPLIVYVVDLPSSLSFNRMQGALKLRMILDGLNLPPPDLVVGDFNMIRGSAAVKTLFPDLRNAYDIGGHGYAATFHRQWPIYHIDLALVSPSIDVTDYQLVDPGMGRHLGQLFYIQPANLNKTPQDQ